MYSVGVFREFSSENPKFFQKFQQQKSNKKKESQKSSVYWTQPTMKSILITFNDEPKNIQTIF